MAVWRVICAMCGLSEHGADEVAALSAFDGHAGHGRRSVHYCADADPDPRNRWDDRDDPRAQIQEAED